MSRILSYRIPEFFVDDDKKTAGELWGELEEIFIMSNPQLFQNLKQKLESLIFNEGGKLQKYVASFLSILRGL